MTCHYQGYPGKGLSWDQAGRPAFRSNRWHNTQDPATHSLFPVEKVTASNQVIECHLRRQTMATLVSQKWN